MSTVTSTTGTLSSAGIGSTLNVAGIVSQLMTTEQGPLTSLQNQESSYKSKISAYGSIQSSMTTFQTALTALGTGLNAQTAVSSDAATVSATTSSDAASGSYAINVTRLASADKQISTTGLPAATTLAAASMSITVGTGTAITIPSANYSIKTLAAAINAAGAGVTASVINDGSKNYLSLTSLSSGASNGITVEATGDLEQFATANMKDTAGQDAELTIDGVKVTKPSNNISDAISGLTLNLTKVSAADTNTTISVTRDDTTIKANIGKFVTAYNTLTSTVKKLTAYDLSTSTAAALNGDSSITSLLSQLGRAVSSNVDGGGAMNSLAAIGITRASDGTLSVDDTKLSAALKSNAGGVANLFNGTNGIGTAMSTIAKDANSTTGVLASKQSTFAARVKTLQTREDAESTRLENVQAAYQAKFSALDTLMASMTTTSSYLTQQIAAMSANN
jgi:flagellar hook-associated protein 2